MNIKKINIMMLVLTIIQVITPLTSLYKFNASETRDTDCFTYELSADRTDVTSGKQIKFTLNYQSIHPVCSAEELNDEEIIIDFSGLVDSGVDIESDFDTEVFNVNIDENGLVTITFKEWDDIHNTLEDFGGSMVFTIDVTTDGEGPITITNNVGSDITINVNPNVVEHNTSKWSTSSYAEVGDVIDYTIRINTDLMSVDHFRGIDSPSPGLVYVPSSFYVTNSSGDTLDPNNFNIEVTDDNLIFTNIDPFSEMYYLHYQMMVISMQETYHNDFEAIYDGVSESSHYTIGYDIGGDGFVDFSNGKIHLTKVDEYGNKLSGAEFDIENEDGFLVDHLITDESGEATSNLLALGTYVVTETKAPVGYVLDSSPFTVVITEDGEVAEVNEGNPIVNMLAVGSIEITKVDEDGNTLVGAEFDIIDSEGNPVDHVVTGEDGVATSIDLPLGDYQVVETIAPDGYTLDTTPHDVTITRSGELVTIEVVNTRIEVGGGKDKETITSETDNQEVVEDTTKEPESSVYTTEEDESSVDTTNKESLATTGSSLIFILIDLIAILIVSIGLKQRIVK